ncbi:MAG: PQQ-binding-like beta-propeller repeat protein [Planctomycetota bacterium]|nr:PQQ-binding-like beta-propeller repeat protein [Planctomycetota bacterium]
MILASTLVLTLLSSAPVVQKASDWPQWRGPDRNGITRESEWDSVGQSAPLWEKQLGLGYSGSVIAQGRLVSLGYDLEAEEDVIWCLDAETGEELWSHRFGADHLANFHGGGTLSTPTIDGDVLYTLNRYGQFYCRRMDDGEIVWERTYRQELNLEVSYHGFCASPLSLGDRLYVTMGGQTIAVDKSNGDVLWRTRNYGDGSYTNAAPITIDGSQCIAVLAAGFLLVLDCETGEALHEYPWKPEGGGASIATPLVMGQRIFISTAYSLGCALLEVDNDEIHTLWKNKRLRNKIGDCILWEDHLYGFDESMLKCLDMEGNEMWRKRGLGMGTLSLADGRLIILSSKGELIVAEATPDEFTELSRERILEGGVYWTTPVLNDGRIYCRNSLGHLVCRDHRPGTQTLTASKNTDKIDSLPEALELFARHVEASGGENAWRSHQSMHVEGSIEITGAGITRTTMTIDRMAPDKWLLAYDVPMAGVIYRAYDGEIGWQLDAFYGDKIYEGDELVELKSVARFHGPLEYEKAYRSARTAEVGEFGDRACWIVETITTSGRARTLYFDQETGLLAGHVGDKESMVMYDDYQSFGDVMIAGKTTVLIPDTGAEEVYYVDRVVFDEVNESVYVRPAKVIRLLRTPEQVEADNKAARKKYARQLGSYRADHEPVIGELYTIFIDDGRLAIKSPQGSVYDLNPPDDEGRWYFAEVPNVYVSFVEDEAGVIKSMHLNRPGREDELPRVETQG